MLNKLQNIAQISTRREIVCASSAAVYDHMKIIAVAYYNMPDICQDNLCLKAIFTDKI